MLLLKVTFATEIAILASSKEGNQHPSSLGYKNQHVILQSGWYCSWEAPIYIFTELQR